MPMQQLFWLLPLILRLFHNSLYFHWIMLCSLHYSFIVLIYHKKIGLFLHLYNVQTIMFHNECIYLKLLIN